MDSTISIDLLADVLTDVTGYDPDDVHQTIVSIAMFTIVSDDVSMNLDRLTDCEVINLVNQFNETSDVQVDANLLTEDAFLF